MRISSFSLNLREIRPSEFVGTRRKAALRDEAYVWATDLRSFDKLREVGVSPYLGFILYLSTLLMFELNEVGLAKFDTAREHDTNPTRFWWVWVEYNRVWVISVLTRLTRLINGSYSC